MSMIEIPDPPGYRVIGWGSPRKDQPYLTCLGQVITSGYDHATDERFVILELIEVWRDATIDDLHRVPLKCRVRDDENEPWVTKELRGGCIVPSGKWKWITDGLQWIYCQVLEEPCSANES